jgi:serine/threonine-protein kinase
LSKLSFELLRVLVASAPNVVRYDILASQVWGARRIVTPENLAKRVMMLRQALGDHADQPRYIEGLRGLGYRLIPEVEHHSPQPPEDSSSAPESASPLSSTLVVTRPERPEGHARRRVDFRVAAAALALALGLGASLEHLVRRAPAPERAVARLLLGVQPAESLVGSYADKRPSRTVMAFSPDGSTLVFTASSGGTSQLYKRRLDEEEASPLPGTVDAIGPFFSPDGAWVGFWAGGKLKKVSLERGLVADIVATAGLFYGGDWGVDDTIVFSQGPGRGISRVAAAGGAADTLVEGDPNESLMQPRLLPGGHAMLFTRLSKRATSVVAYRFDTAEKHTLIDDGADARFSRSGHLLFMRSGVLMAAPFDSERLTVLGTPIAVVADVMQAVGASNRGDATWAGQFDVAGNGTLVYVTGGLHPMDIGDAFWVERSGSATRIPIEGPVATPRISPDGTRIAYVAARSAIPPAADIWVYDIARQIRIRLTREGANAWPVWSPDGKNLAFSTSDGDADQLALVAADGSQPLVALTPGTGTSARFLAPSSWSGNQLMLVSSADHDVQIWALDVAVGGETRQPHVVVNGPARDSHPALSPDGRWLAYASTETGVREVYVQRYPNAGPKTPLSAGGGYAPIWAADGREIYYWQPTSPKRVIAVGFDASGDLPVVGESHVLFEPNEYYNGEPVRGWDLSPDGQKFLVMKDVPEPPLTQMHVVINWATELRRNSASDRPVPGFVVGERQ